jgi:hypothetical protein
MGRRALCRRANSRRQMSALDHLNWKDVRSHYDGREEVHQRLLTLSNEEKFVNLILGIDDPRGNYSASEHALGAQILSSNPNAVKRVADLAREFRSLKSAATVPELVRLAALRYLKIGVGSEVSCMVNPHVCWVANTRTIWTHLVIKHADDFGKADEELKLYRTQDDTSEMAYRIWAEIHRELSTSMTRIAKEGEKQARHASVTPGSITYLWADAIANALYESYYG